MEPANVDHPGAGDPLEQLLREAKPRIADNGFSIQVIAEVDAGRRRAKLRLGLMVAGGASGLTVAAAAGAFGPDAARVSTDLQRSFADLAAVAQNPSVMIAAFVTVAALVYVFRRSPSDV